jgi:hypothetical protein
MSPLLNRSGGFMKRWSNLCNVFHIDCCLEFGYSPLRKIAKELLIVESWLYCSTVEARQGFKSHTVRKFWALTKLLAFIFVYVCISPKTVPVCLRHRVGV